MHLKYFFKLRTPLQDSIVFQYSDLNEDLAVRGESSVLNDCLLRVCVVLLPTTQSSLCLPRDTLFTHRGGLVNTNWPW